jgi:hypothetical protein
MQSTGPCTRRDNELPWTPRSAFPHDQEPCGHRVDRGRAGTCRLRRQAKSGGRQGSPRRGIAGFFPGLWHGIISPVTFIISLFTDDVSVYEVRNSGNWYDFGFVLGAGILFGGIFRAGRSGRD